MAAPWLVHTVCGAAEGAAGTAAAAASSADGIQPAQLKRAMPQLNGAGIGYKLSTCSQKNNFTVLRAGN